MRILVMFDLPTGTAVERKAYAEFRKFLVKDGFAMEQYSVYSRVALGRDNAKTHVDRISQNLPEYGSVTVFVLTERQYSQRLVLLGKPAKPTSSSELGVQMTLGF